MLANDGGRIVPVPVFSAIMEDLSKGTAPLNGGKLGGGGGVDAI